MNEIVEKNKAVDKPVFWEERIAQALASGDIRHSVYRAPEDMWQEMRGNHQKILTSLINPEDNVLDAGCGYGRLRNMLSSNVYYGGSYHGVDISADFIILAQELFPDSKFSVGNLINLAEFENNTFDWAICCSVMIMTVQNLGWSHWEKIQNELLRVAKKILVLEYGKGDTDTESSTYYIINGK